MFFIFFFSCYDDSEFTMIITSITHTLNSTFYYIPCFIVHRQKYYMALRAIVRNLMLECVLPINCSNSMKSYPGKRQIKRKIYNFQNPINIKKNDKINHP